MVTIDPIARVGPAGEQDPPVPRTRLHVSDVTWALSSPCLSRSPIAPLDSAMGATIRRQEPDGVLIAETRRLRTSPAAIAPTSSSNSPA